MLSTTLQLKCNAITRDWEGFVLRLSSVTGSIYPQATPRRVVCQMKPRTCRVVLRHVEDPLAYRTLTIQLLKQVFGTLMLLLVWAVSSYQLLSAPVCTEFPFAVLACTRHVQVNDVSECKGPIIL